MVADVADEAVHDKDGTNPHAHNMLTMRELTAKGLGQEARELAGTRTVY